MPRSKHALAESWAVQPDYFNGRPNAVANPVVPGGATVIALGGNGSGRSSWLLCRAGMHLCAMPIAHVIEIMRVLPIDAISGAPSYVRGLCIMRGAPVPVVDTGLLLGDEPAPSGRLVAIRAGSRTIALVVERVEGILGIGPEAFIALPPLLGDAATAAIAAIGTLDAQLLLFLRATRIVPDALLARLDAERAAT
jgi:purine-binding chemotaxis protein CheW